MTMAALPMSASRGRTCAAEWWH